MTHQVKSNRESGQESVDIVAVQDAKLRQMNDDKIEFLRSLTTFGIQSKKPDVSMKEIFTWGAEGPYDQNDYTKKKAELNNKIKKMHRSFISESRDNYRNPYVQRATKAGDEDAVECTVGVCVRCKQSGRILRFLMGEIDENVKYENFNT